MGFSKNLRSIRKDKNLSQEQLAELLNISRQSVSKWEQNEGYPEAEKLIQMARVLDVSLDSLLLDRQMVINNDNDAPLERVATSPDKKLFIKSMDGKTATSYYKFEVQKNHFALKGQPVCGLFGVDKSSFFWGDNEVLLGWYASFADAHKEMEGIYQAITAEKSVYELKYNADTKLNKVGLPIINTK